MTQSSRLMFRQYPINVSNTVYYSRINLNTGIVLAVFKHFILNLLFLLLVSVRALECSKYIFVVLKTEEQVDYTDEQIISFIAIF